MAQHSEPYFDLCQHNISPKVIPSKINYLASGAGVGAEESGS